MELFFKLLYCIYGIAGIFLFVIFWITLIIDEVRDRRKGYTHQFKGARDAFAYIISLVGSSILLALIWPVVIIYLILPEGRK